MESGKIGWKVLGGFSVFILRGADMSNLRVLDTISKASNNHFFLELRETGFILEVNQG